MPRSARKKSNSNVYHIMMRGVNRQSIFEDEEDCLRFLEIIRLAKEKCDFKVYAWCLMGNHVHLLMRFGVDSPETVMKKIDVTYAMYYNQKNEKLGPLFADRFKSEPVEDDAYLISVARYIHRNPVKAGICKAPEEYIWSSCLEYMKAGGKRPKLRPIATFTDTEFLLGIQDISELIKYTSTANDDEYLEIPEKQKITMSDSRAREIMTKKISCESIADFRALALSDKVRGTKKLYKSGMSVSQICRLTGMSRPTVYKYLGE